MPPASAAASVRSQYHSRSRASAAPKSAASTLMPMGECSSVIAKKNVSATPPACACRKFATRLSSPTSALRAVMFHAIARKSASPRANALQPAIASARGERLGGCGPSLLLLGGGVRLAISLARLALHLALGLAHLAIGLAVGLLLGGGRLVRAVGGRLRLRAGRQRGEREERGEKRRYQLAHGAGWRM